jgi:hypothetical protein
MSTCRHSHLRRNYKIESSLCSTYSKFTKPNSNNGGGTCVRASDYRTVGSRTQVEVKNQECNREIASAEDEKDGRRKKNGDGGITLSRYGGL